MNRFCCFCWKKKKVVEIDRNPLIINDMTNKEPAIEIERQQIQSVDDKLDLPINEKSTNSEISKDDLLSNSKLDEFDITLTRCDSVIVTNIYDSLINDIETLIVDIKRNLEFIDSKSDSYHDYSDVISSNINEITKLFKNNNSKDISNKSNEIKQFLQLKQQEIVGTKKAIQLSSFTTNDAFKKPRFQNIINTLDKFIPNSNKKSIFGEITESKIVIYNETNELIYIIKNDDKNMKNIKDFGIELGMNKLRLDIKRDNNIIISQFKTIPSNSFGEFYSKPTRVYIHVLIKQNNKYILLRKNREILRGSAYYINNAMISAGGYEISDEYFQALLE